METLSDSNLTAANREKWDKYFGYSVNPKYRVVILDDDKERWLVVGNIKTGKVNYHLIEN